MNNFKDIKIAVAGTGYVGLSIATLLSQHHCVTAVDVIPEKVEKLNNRVSPIQADYTTQASVMVAIACQRIPSSFWRTMLMFLRT